MQKYVELSIFNLQNSCTCWSFGVSTTLNNSVLLLLISEPFNLPKYPNM